MSQRPDGEKNGAVRAISQGADRDPWVLWRQCKHGVACVGPDRYPEEVEHRLRHNAKRDSWWYECRSCGATNSLPMPEMRRDLLRRLAQWRETMQVVEQSGAGVQEAML